MSYGYVLDSAVVNGDLVRTRIFLHLGFVFKGLRKKFRLANRLDFFCYFFHQGKK